MLRIGFMDYANVYPIFHYMLKDSNLVFEKGVPSSLNVLLRSGKIDISPVSSIEFSRNHELYRIVDNVCVSSRGAVKSVLLLSDYSIKELDGKKVYFTKESNTSTVLCRIILELFYKIKPIYVSERTEYDAELLIGDRALTEYYNTGYKNIIDLGLEWFNHVNLPFVFALWTVNKNAVNNEYFASFEKQLKEYASIFPKDIAELAPRYISRGYTKEQLEDYWNTIIYEFTDEHKKGLSLFYKYACEIGESGSDSSIFIKDALI